VDEIEALPAGAFFSGRNAFCKELKNGSSVSTRVGDGEENELGHVAFPTVYAAALQATEKHFESQV
jgi:hypothetical protein